MEWLKKINSNSLSYQEIFLTLLVIIGVRVVIEWLLLSFPIQMNVFQDYARFYLENTYYFLILFLVVATFVSQIIRQPLRDVMNFGVKIYPVIWLPPLIDALLYGRQEGYYYAQPENFIWNLLTLSFVRGDASRGISWEILLALIFIGIYIFRQTRSVVKSILTAFFAHVFLTTLSTPGLFFGPERATYTFDLFLPFYYFFPFIILLILLFYAYDEQKLKAILVNLRPVRAIAFMTAVVAGSIIRYKASGAIYPFHVFLSSVAIFCVWEVSVIINDIYDQDIDALTNKDRPLVQQVLIPQEYFLLALILGFLAFSLTVIVNHLVGGLILVTLGLAYGYSCPPFRLRKHFSGNIIIGLALVICLYIGFFTLDPYGKVPLELVRLAALCFIFGVFVPLVKDIKDIDGDKKNQVVNLFTLLPRDKAKRIVLIILLIVLNIPILLVSPIVIIVLSSVAVFSFYRWEAIRVVYLIGIVIGCLSFTQLLPPYAPRIVINKSLSTRLQQTLYPNNYVIFINSMNQIKGMVNESNAWLVLRRLLIRYEVVKGLKSIPFRIDDFRFDQSLYEWWPGVDTKLYFKNKPPMRISLAADVTAWVQKNKEQPLSEEQVKKFLSDRRLAAPFQDVCTAISCRPDLIIRSSQYMMESRHMDLLSMANVVSSLGKETDFLAQVRTENLNMINYIIEHYDYHDFMPYVEPQGAEEFLLLFYDQAFQSFLSEKARQKIQDNFKERFQDLPLTPIALLLTPEGKPIEHIQVAALNKDITFLMYHYALKHFSFLQEDNF